MTDENPRFLPASNVGIEYMNLIEYVEEQAKGIEPRQSFHVDPSYDFKMLVGILKTSFKKIKMVAIDHGENGYEVRRLHDSADVNFFYQCIKKEDGLNQIGTDDCENAIIKAAERAFAGSYKILKNEKCVPDAFIVGKSVLQRNVLALACYRKSLIGAGEQFKVALESLESQGRIRKIDRKIALENFGTTAVLYEIKPE